MNTTKIVVLLSLLNPGCLPVYRMTLQGPHCNGLHKPLFPLFYLEGFLLHARFLPFSLWRVYFFLHLFHRTVPVHYWRFFPSPVPWEQPLYVIGLNFSNCSIGTLFSSPEGFIFSFTCSTGNILSYFESFLHSPFQCHWLVLFSTILLIQELWRFLFYFPSFAMHGASPSVEGQSVPGTRYYLPCR